eukprot:11364986-Alexandrium_andersonii.AAC.1
MLKRLRAVHPHSLSPRDSVLVRCCPVVASAGSETTVVDERWSLGSRRRQLRIPLESLAPLHAKHVSVVIEDP